MAITPLRSPLSATITCLSCEARHFFVDLLIENKSRKNTVKVNIINLMTIILKSYTTSSLSNTWISLVFLGHLRISFNSDLFHKSIGIANKPTNKWYFLIWKLVASHFFPGRRKAAHIGEKHHSSLIMKAKHFW